MRTPEQKRQYRFLLAWPLVATLLALAIHANYIVSQVLFWGLPAAVLTFWAWKHVKKVALFSAILTPGLIAMDLVFYLTGQWYVSSSSYKLFNIVAWGDIPYFFLFVYFPILFWEHFYERTARERPWRHQMYYFVGVVGLFCLTFMGGWKIAPHILEQIPYFYVLVMVFLAGVPLTLELTSHPRLVPKFVHVGVYFAYVAILYEVTAIYLGLWYYPSDQFLGWVEILGTRFPIEEFITWILIGAPVVLAWYEFFDDDNR